MPIKEAILEVLGWIGLVIMFLVVAIIIGAIAMALLTNLEYGTSLLLLGVIVISGGIVGAYWLYRVWLSEKEYLLPPRFVACPYCGMKNDVISEFCIKCGKAIPKNRLGQASSKRAEL